MVSGEEGKLIAAAVGDFPRIKVRVIAINNLDIWCQWKVELFLLHSPGDPALAAVLTGLKLVNNFTVINKRTWELSKVPKEHYPACMWRKCYLDKKLTVPLLFCCVSWLVLEEKLLKLCVRVYLNVFCNTTCNLRAIISSIPVEFPSLASWCFTTPLYLVLQHTLSPLLWKMAPFFRNPKRYRLGSEVTWL